MKREEIKIYYKAKWSLVQLCSFSINYNIYNITKYFKIKEKR